MSELHQYDSEGQQMQDSWQRELARIFDYLRAGETLKRDDQPLVLRAFGLDEKPRKERWAEMACDCE